MSATTPSLLKRITPQLIILAVVLGLNVLVFPDFFDVSFRNGRIFGNLVDVFNRGAPVALLCIGMTLVIATKGIDLSVGAVMAIAGATAASLVTEGHGWGTALIGALATGLLCGLWNGVLVAVLRIQPIVATLVLMVAGRGIANLTGTECFSEHCKRRRQHLCRARKQPPLVVLVQQPAVVDLAQQQCDVRIGMREELAHGRVDLGRRRSDRKVVQVAVRKGMQQQQLV